MAFFGTKKMFKMAYKGGYAIGAGWAVTKYASSEYFLWRQLIFSFLGWLVWRLTGSVCPACSFGQFP